ncbi:MAG TPA: hypothetical protein PKM25_13140 [Candidatus Ozemobacteraceae bacterium]|nr:hypothetical protein [Candidatus Ozemobacteraceae bacterium]
MAIEKRNSFPVPYTTELMSPATPHHEVIPNRFHNMPKRRHGTHSHVVFRIIYCAYTMSFHPARAIYIYYIIYVLLNGAPSFERGLTPVASRAKMWAFAKRQQRKTAQGTEQEKTENAK